VKKGGKKLIMEVKKDGTKGRRKVEKKERKKARLYECTWLTHQPLFSFITARFRNKVNTNFSHFNEHHSCLACVSVLSCTAIYARMSAEPEYYLTVRFVLKLVSDWLWFVS